MEENFDVRIDNGNTVLYSIPFSLELGLLVYGAPEARRRLREQVGAVEELDTPLILPSSDQERYERAIRLVELIGEAVRRELIRVHYGGAFMLLIKSFKEGLWSLGEPEEFADGTLENLCFECGRRARDIVGSVLPEGANLSPEDLFRATERISRAFIKGAAHAFAFGV